MSLENLSKIHPMMSRRNEGMDPSSTQRDPKSVVAERSADRDTRENRNDDDAHRADMLGGWDLVVVVWSDERGGSGTETAASGTLVYLDDGTFSLHINATDRSPYLAAHGLFSQQRRGVIAHHVEGSTDRRGEGTSYWYRATFSRYHLVLEADRPATTLLRTVWER